jgi:hypothetical protein
MSAAIFLVATEVLGLVHDGHRVIARTHQELSNHGTDLARTDDDNVFHATNLRKGKILSARSPTNGRVVPGIYYIISGVLKGKTDDLPGHPGGI